MPGLKIKCIGPFITFQTISNNCPQILDHFVIPRHYWTKLPQLKYYVPTLASAL